MQNDKEIMFAVKAGDLEKLGILFERHHLRMYNYFLKATYQPQTSEDLVQEVFFRLMKFRHTYRGDGLFTTWLYKVAQNVLYDHVRKKRTGTSIDDVVEQMQSEDDVHEDYEMSEEVKLLEKAFRMLKDSDRELLNLKRFQELKYEEIAKIKNLAVGTIKSKIHHAMKNLKVIYIELSDEAKL
ncbi:MAG: RNA polymerase sigma factor [bacterium]|nr:RNA polymerase sigma factor [bacterium]